MRRYRFLVVWECYEGSGRTQFERYKKHLNINDISQIESEIKKINGIKSEVIITNIIKL